MTRNAILAGASRGTAKGPSSIACLAFVAVLGTAFWAGAVWIGNILLQLLATV